MMQVPKTIQENLRFLLIEVNTQLKRLLMYLDTESESVAYRIMNRGGYAANLNERIQNACTLQIAKNLQSDSMSLRAITSIASELEKIMGLSMESVHQLELLSTHHKIDLARYKPFAQKVVKGLGLIEKSFFDNDTRLALKLTGIEGDLDKSYKKLLHRYTIQLKKHKNTEDLVTALFVAHTMGNMGEAILNIGEAILSSNIGQPMDKQRYQFLLNTIGSKAGNHNLETIDLRQMAETRSGSGISSVNYTDEDNNEQLAVFKEGEKQKLKEELRGVERWHQVYPGVAPRILTYKKEGKSAALLIEHLDGLTFEKTVLKASDVTRLNAMKALKKTLYSVWDDTRKEQKVSAGFMCQIRRRLSDIYAVHPYFKQSDSTICGLKLSSLEKRLAKAEQLESKLRAPFSVFIHGDFNVDNIIYDTQSHKIKFIDLHRSAYMDYVQDVSVFMVSNYRLQVLDPKVRRRIRQQIESMYSIARQYAKMQADTTFEIRLAFGLARSFLTSTRFILDKSMATRMALRANFLMERVIQLDAKQYGNYRLPVKPLFTD